MGRIADAAIGDVTQAVRTNVVDDILDELDDEDRAVVLSWLLGDRSANTISADLDSHGIRCSSDSIRRWRGFQERGRGRVWVA